MSALTTVSMQVPGFRASSSTPTTGLRRRPSHLERRRRSAPWLIARCCGTADVAAAVRCARHRRLEIAVRGEVLAIAGTAVCDGGIVIDLSAMRAVSVDPVERTALVQGGALWAMSTARPRPAGWPPRRHRQPHRRRRRSTWAAASAGSCASTGSRSATSWRPGW